MYDAELGVVPPRKRVDDVSNSKRDGIFDVTPGHVLMLGIDPAIDHCLPLDVRWFVTCSTKSLFDFRWVDHFTRQVVADLV